MIAEFKPDKWK